MILHFINDDLSGGAQVLLAGYLETHPHWGCLSIKKLSQDSKYQRGRQGVHGGLFQFATLIWILKNYRKIKIVHTHLFPALYLAVFIFPFKSKVFTEHSTYNRRQNYLIFQVIDSFFYSRYARVVCISVAVRDALVGRGVSPERLVTIYNGVRSASPVKMPSERKSETVVIGMAARFVASKAHDNLVKALSRLPDEFELQLAGDGPRLEPVRELAERLGLSDRVSFWGHVDDMAGFYGSCDIYAQASNWEGFGLAVVEASFMNLPVIASGLDAIKEVLGDQSEFYFDVRNTDDIANAILRCYQNKTEFLRDQKKATSRFSFARHILELETLYESLV